MPLTTFPSLPLVSSAHCVYLLHFWTFSFPFYFLDPFVPFFYNQSPPQPFTQERMTSRHLQCTILGRYAGLSSTRPQSFLAKDLWARHLPLNLRLPCVNSDGRIPREVGPSREPWMGVWCRAGVGSHPPPLPSTVK